MADKTPKDYSKETVSAGTQPDADSFRGTPVSSYPLIPSASDKFSEAFLPKATSYELDAVRKRRKKELGIKDDDN